MGCHIYITDTVDFDVPSVPSVRVPSTYEGTRFFLRDEAHKFVKQIRAELECPELTHEQRVHVLERAWRDEPIEQRERDAINLDWIDEIIDSPRFGKLSCS